MYRKTEYHNNAELTFTATAGFLSQSRLKMLLMEYCNIRGYGYTIEDLGGLLKHLYKITIKLPYNEAENAVTELRDILH